MIPTPGKPKKFGDSTVYHPSIYSYTCRGGFFVSSEDQGREGSCRGVRTRLELLADMEPGSRENAIKSFTYMTDYDMDDEDANTLNQKTKSILVSPALIYKEQGDESQKSAPLLEEELIRRQSWSCYGSTEVEMLVLKDEEKGSEHVAAIAPRNVGLSIRKIETDDGNISSIAVGWVNIVVDTGLIEEEGHGQQHSAQPQRHPTAPVDPESTKHGQQTLQADEAMGSNTLSPATPEVPPKPSQDSIQRAKVHLTRFCDFSLKVGDQMKHNVIWLSDTLQDDFPSRFMSSGKKIVAEMPKTIDRTSRYMCKMYDRWVGDDDEES